MRKGVGQVPRMSGTDSLFLAGETPNWHQHVAGLVVLDPGEDPRIRLRARRAPRRRAPPARPEAHVEAQDRPDGSRPRALGRRRGVRPAAPPASPACRCTRADPARSRPRSRPCSAASSTAGTRSGRCGSSTGSPTAARRCSPSSTTACSTAVRARSSRRCSSMSNPTPGTDARASPTPEPHRAPDDLHLLAGGLVSAARAALPGGCGTLTRMTRRGVDLVGHVISGRDAPGPRRDADGAEDRRSTLPSGRGAPSPSAAWPSTTSRPCAGHFDVKVNDVALSMCSGAIRSYLERDGELPDRELTAGVPVSLRQAGDASLDNQLSYLVLPLGTQYADPVERLLHVAEQSRAAKERASDAARASRGLHRRHGPTVRDRLTAAPRVRDAHPLLHPGDDEHDRFERAGAARCDLYLAGARAHGDLLGERARSTAWASTSPCSASATASTSACTSTPTSSRIRGRSPKRCRPSSRR